MNVSESNLMTKLAELAEMLPNNRARHRLYKVAESLMRVAFGQGFVAGIRDGLVHSPFLGVTSAKVNLSSSLSEADAWTDYLAQEGAKYQGD